MVNFTKINLPRLLFSKKIWILVCKANYTKSDWSYTIFFKKFNITALLKCFSRAPKFNNCPRNKCIVMIYGTWQNAAIPWKLYNFSFFFKVWNLHKTVIQTITYHYFTKGDEKSFSHHRNTKRFKLLNCITH